jgi:hypothetical protein
MTIPDEAVEAAACTVGSAMWGYLTPAEAARQILEASAPQLMAEVWDACLGSDTPWINPYRKETK